MEPWQYLKEYVGQRDTKEDGFIEACWTEAKVLVDRFIGTASVPDEIYTRSILEVGANLFQRKRAGNRQSDGIVQGTPVFTAKDPLNSVYDQLSRFVGRLG